ncbi:Methyltransferase domain-containing protein [Maribacter dokdonensis]|uniref:Methyltransferase domain-containing protein n=1 Tax=Maribacter dokdonensis TaxID=320912 RepID=A0ABY0UB40_9FLAO|nr:class I SAM-dependent methyltransferase [Maribacter dokdonensis]SDS37238.1 Methyltransferase domain-containing protein [Maribacter dokdonensis]
MKRQLKELTGAILVQLQCKKAESIIKKGISFNVGNELNFNERLMRAALLKQAEKNEDFNLLANYHKNFWKHTGRKYFSEKGSVLNDFFLPHCLPVFQSLKKLLEGNPEKYHTMIEIGTGNGEVLEYLSRQFPQIEKFVGIDLSTDQIEFNTKKYQQYHKLNFEAADGAEWIRKNGTDNIIVFTSGGVLEYFTQQQLNRLFRSLKYLKNTIFIAIEPIGVDVDFTKNPNSQPYGTERSFSHNYTQLFEDTGFSLWYQSVIEGVQKEADFGVFGAINL